MMQFNSSYGDDNLLLYAKLRRKLFENKTNKIYLSFRAFTDLKENDSKYNLLSDDRFLSLQYKVIYFQRIEEVKTSFGIRLQLKDLKSLEYELDEDKLYYMLYVDENGNYLHIERIINKGNKLTWKPISIRSKLGGRR